MTERFNVVLLTVDAWRPDFVDTHAGVRLTPSLDRVADQTVRFDNAYASAPWTTPAMVSVFTGQSALSHRVWFEWDEPAPERPALAQHLAAHGWSTPNLSYLNELANYDHLGYRRSEAPARPEDESDPLLFDAIEATPEPFFLWYHYKWVHLPYWAPADCRRALDVETVPDRLAESVGTGFVVPRRHFSLRESDAPTIRRMYAAGVLAFDRFLGRVLDGLHRRGITRRTSLVLTSDHGEELLEHGHVGHASTAHHATVYEEVLRVPLRVVDPRVAAPSRVRTRVWGPDLYSTIAALAGAPVATGVDGVDLSPAIVGDGLAVPDDRLFAFHSARMGCPTPRELSHQQVLGLSDGRTKLVMERYDEDDVRRYDLVDDPMERVPMHWGGATS